MIRIIKKTWMPFIIVVVVAIAGFTVSRVRAYFGAQDATSVTSPTADRIAPFNPKHVTYEIFGPPGAVATINYLDLNAELHTVDNTPLPWSITLTTTAPAVLSNIVAQGDSNSIGCRIIVDGQAKDERKKSGVSAQTFCQVKSA